MGRKLEHSVAGHDAVSVSHSAVATRWFFFGFFFEPRRSTLEPLLPPYVDAHLPIQRRMMFGWGTTSTCLHLPFVCKRPPRPLGLSIIVWKRGGVLGVS